MQTTTIMRVLFPDNRKHKKQKTNKCEVAMANKPNPNRKKAKNYYVKNLGKVSNKDIVNKFGVTASQVSRWKRADKWDEALVKRRGAPLGNKNAVGGGAPLKNVNAETHGAYTKIHLDDLTDEQAQLLQKLCSLDVVGKLNYELQLLFLKEQDIEKRLSELEKNVTVENGEVYDTLHLDRKIVVGSEKGETVTTVNVSTFQRRASLETELDKIHGRILKVLKAITDYEFKRRNQRLAEKSYVLQKQKISGEFIYDNEGNLDDSYDDENELAEVGSFGV